jgi:hypothetical protein
MEEEAIKQIGERLKGLRRRAGNSGRRDCRSLRHTPEAYLQMESGNGELHVSNLQKIANRSMI